MTELLDLCYDVLIQILEEINPEDLAACAQTSWAFNTFIKKNTRLYKAQYLRNFDNPWRVQQNREPDWVSDLQRLVKCQKMLQSANNDLKRSEFKFVATTVEDLIASASLDESGDSLNQKFVVEMFQYISQNHDAFMSRSSLYGRAGKMNQKPADSEESRQLSAKLHCLFGIPSTNVGRRVLSTHPYARSRVYDLRNYTDETKWGPYQDANFKVDWQMIESIMIVLSYNSGLCCRRFLHRFRPPWSEPLEGVIGDRAQLIKSPLANISIPKEPSLPLDLQDPYNIAGVWSRIVCFLDYDDLYNYNFGPTAMKCHPESPRDPIDTEEAIRHIIMDLHVTSITPPSKFDNPTLPVVHFNGKSRSVDAAWDPNANSKIRGSVSLTPEGEVRWTTVSVFYGGEERWASEGIQVGGLRSRRGVVGSWFDKDFDPHGPAGPTAFWKICDHNLSEHEDEGSEDSGDEVGNWH